MNKRLRYFMLAGFFLGIVLAGIYFWNAIRTERATAAMANPMKVATDVIGTRIGTTTTGVAWYGAANSSTSYPIYVGGSAKVAVITIGVEAASSTDDSHIMFSLLGSNDPWCTATTTSTVQDIPTTAMVKWFDASKHLANSSVITSLSSATSTFIWTNPVVGMTRELILENLAVQCLAVRVTASSTILWSQARFQE